MTFFTLRVLCFFTRDCELHPCKTPKGCPEGDGKGNPDATSHVLIHIMMYRCALYNKEFMSGAFDVLLSYSKLLKTWYDVHWKLSNILHACYNSFEQSSIIYYQRETTSVVEYVLDLVCSFLDPRTDFRPKRVPATSRK